MAVGDSGLGVYILLVILLSVYLRTGLAQPGTRTRCTDISRPNDTAEIVLTCNDSFSWFHVVEELYSANSTDGCNPLGINAPTKLNSNSDTALAVTCIGKQKHQQQNTEVQCTEKVSRWKFRDDLNRDQQFVSVKYECVEDDLNFNICDDVSVERPGDVYLASPDFFDQNVSSDICRCRVVTAGLQLQALYISIDNDTILNMTCDQCHQYNFTWNRITVINILETKGNDSVNIMDISFRHIAQPLYRRNRVWLKVTGTQNVSVLCNENIIPTEPPLTPGSTTKTSDTTTSSSPTATTGTHTASSTKHTSPSSTTSASETTSDTTASSPTRPTTETSTVTSAENTVSGPATHTSETSSQGQSHTTKQGSCCSKDTTGDTTLTMDSNENSSFGTSTSDTVQDTVTDRSQDTLVYIIVGVVAGVSVLVCCILIVVFILRRKRQTREKLEMKSLYNVSAELEPDHSTLTGVFGPQDVCEVDLDDDPAQSGVNSHSAQAPENWFLKGTHTFTDDESNGIRSNRVTPPVQSGDKKSVHKHQGPSDIADKGALDQPDQKVPESKHLYFILEPEYEGEDQSDGSFAAGRMTKASVPDIAEKGSFARTGQNEPESKNLYFILEPEQEDHNDKSLAAGRMTQASVPDGNDYDDERCHYYSEIKDEEDAEQRIGPATAPSSSRRGKGPLSAGDYELVDLDSDKGDEDITKLERSQGTPGRNPAADSPQSLSQTPRQDAADNTYSVIDDSDNEEDELIMHDNVVYQSSAALEHDKDRSVMGDDDAGQREGDVERKDEDDSDDEDMVMVDNVVYQSCMDKESDNEDTDVEER